MYSRERDVDPVGACVGMKGTRVQAIIRELRGEKIDIVEWSDDPVTFVTNAISPARVQHVSVVDETEKIIEVVVEDSQLSLAIGKKGQNVRLAAKLSGWRVDIKSEEEKRAEVEAQFAGLEAAEEAATLTLPGLVEEQLVKLSEAGLDTAALLLEATPERIAEVAGLDQSAAEDLQVTVREQVEVAERAAAEAAARAEQESAEATDANESETSEASMETEGTESDASYEREQGDPKEREETATSAEDDTKESGDTNVAS